MGADTASRTVPLSLPTPEREPWSPSQNFDASWLEIWNLDVEKGYRRSLPENADIGFWRKPTSEPISVRDRCVVLIGPFKALHARFDPCRYHCHGLGVVTWDAHGQWTILPMTGVLGWVGVL